MSSYFRPRRLTAAQQAAGIRQLWPGFTTSVHRGRLEARGRLRGSSITLEYIVRIEYREGDNPRAYVESPQLVRRASEPDSPIPHTYEAAAEGSERPCLYLPGVDWHSNQAIARTILPWLQCWLVDYEIWRATGHWSGGGAHPRTKSDKGPET